MSATTANATGAETGAVGIAAAAQGGYSQSDNGETTTKGNGDDMDGGASLDGELADDGQRPKR